MVRTTRKPRTRGRQALLEDELKATNVIGGYHGSIICTDQGLLVASDGDIPSDEGLAAFASLFDEIVTRGGRDLGMRQIDEVTLLDRDDGRLVIRPLTLKTSAPHGGPDDDKNDASDAIDTRMFLVVMMNADATWRRNLTRLASNLVSLLADVFGEQATE